MLAGNKFDSFNMLSFFVTHSILNKTKKNLPNQDKIQTLSCDPINIQSNQNYCYKYSQNHFSFRFYISIWIRTFASVASSQVGTTLSI